MKRFGIVTAAGESRRMGFDKILTPIADGECALGLSVRAMLRGGCEAVVVGLTSEAGPKAAINFS